jgi:Putative Flp pilus-assembly TadE/G-like
MRFLRDEGGQAAILAALSLAVILGMVALAIDVGQLRYQKRAMQGAVDAAALAAGLEIRVCGTTPNCAAMQAAARAALVENGFSGATLTTNCSSTSTTGLTLQVNDPPCSLGTSDPNYGNNHYVEAVISRQEPLFFARVLGIPNIKISARAEAERDPTAPCIYALDPTGAGAINMLIGLGVQSKCGIVDESSNSAALTCAVGLVLSAPSISVTGGTSGILCGSTPMPRTSVPRPTPADPLAYLPTPPTAGNSCGTSIASPYTGSPAQVSILIGAGSNIVFNPGVYCGGIAITAGLLTHITFNPGMYILKTGPAAGVAGVLGAKAGGLNITVSALSIITGQGVTFYNQGATGNLSVTVPSIAGLSNFNLSAPTSGEYGGVLFFQAHGDTNPGTFSVNLASGNNFQGAIYLPSAPVTYAVSAISAAYNILVAYDISFGVASLLSTFGNNYAAQATGSPLFGDDAVLIQ